MPDRTTGENQMSKLLDLMKKLGSDAALAAEYDKDAELVMQRAGLPDEQRRALVAKDYTSINTLNSLVAAQFSTNQTIKTYVQSPPSTHSHHRSWSGPFPPVSYTLFFPV